MTQTKTPIDLQIAPPPGGGGDVVAPLAGSDLAPPVAAPPARPWPAAIAWLASLFWLALCAVYFITRGDSAALLALPPREVALLAAAVILPVAIFWLIAFYVRRNEDLRLSTLALQRSLAALTYPGEGSQARVAAVVETLRHQARELNSATERARLEADRLEQVFRSQTERLEEAA